MCRKKEIWIDLFCAFVESTNFLFLFPHPFAKGGRVARCVGWFWLDL